MKRNKSTWFAVAVLGGSIAFQPLAYADDFTGRAAGEMDKIYNQRLDQIRRSNDPPEVKAQKIRQLADEYNQAMGTGTNGGLAGAMNRTGSAIGSGTNVPRQPGFWDKAGEKALDIIAELLKQAITNWMNKPTEENLRKIEALERERDRMMNERNNPVADNPANGFGRPVYDSNGNVIGWDRDGDGRPDSTDTNGDGRPDAFNGGSNDNGYADPYEYLDGGAAGTTGGGTSLASGSRPIYDAAGNLMGFDTNGDGMVDLAASNPAAPANSAGGGASVGGSGGAGVSGGAAAGGIAEGKEGEDKEKEDKEKEDLAVGEGKDGVKTGKDGKTADGKRDRNGDGVDDDRQLEVVMGRFIVLPKVDPLNPDATPTPGVRPAAGGAANVRPGTAGAQPGGPAAAPTKPLEDDWNDAEDNGDKGPDDWGEEWGDEWGDGSGGGAGSGGGWGGSGNGAQPGKPAKPGQPGQPGATRARPGKETEIVDQLIRVETVIAEWRKQAKEEANGARDPYAFHDGAGMQGADGKTEDPLAEYRLPDGKLDLTRVDIWIVERDSWKEGQEPRRFMVTVDEAAIDTINPMPGHYVMCRGVMSKVESLDPRVLDEIKGAVKKLDLVQVVLQSETPPEEGMNPDGTPATPGEPGAKPGTKPNPGGGAAPTDEDW